MQKITIANDFKSCVCKLIKLMQAKRPKDEDIKNLGAQILTIHSINEFEIIEKAGPIILKYKDILIKFHEIKDFEGAFWNTEESKLVKASEHQEKFQNIIKCVAQDASQLKDAEKKEIANIFAKLIEAYLLYILAEKKMSS